MSRATRVPPNDIGAEESLLGAMMLSTAAVEIALRECVADDFYKPQHGHIFEAIEYLYQHGVKVDPITLASRLAETNMIDAIGGPAVLITLQARTPSTSNARQYARIVVERATMRQLIGAVGEIAEMAYEGGDAGEVLDRSRELMQMVDLPTGGNRPPSMDVDEFLQEEDVYDWIVPGLIERTDRTMITGPEGHGKSTLLRQMAMAISSGIHPFQYHPFVMSNDFVPSVTIVDIENSKNQIRRNLRPLRRIPGVERGYLDGHLRLECRPEGIDLTQRHDARWLEDVVASNRPDLLVIGPVYKLYDGDLNKEELIRKVLRVLDLIRIRYGCALLIEAHSPHADGGKRDLRPIGSSIWMRWPEFGYGLAPDKDEPDKVFFNPWRGARDQREWPRRLVRSDVWPWGTGRQYGRPVHHDDDSGRYEPEPDDDMENF